MIGRFTGEFVSQWVADELRVDALIAEVLFLEGKNAREAINVVADFVDAMRAPCPELRGDEVERGYTGCLRAGDEVQMQRGRVDDDGCVEGEATQALVGCGHHLDRLSCDAEGAEKHGCVAGHVEEAMATGADHERTGDADETSFGINGERRADE